MVPEHKKEARNAWTRAYNKAQRVRCLSHYSKGVPKCKCCGEKEILFLAMDHIDPKTKTRKRGSNIWNELIAQGYPEGFQVLCHNCNVAKGRGPVCPVHAANK